MIFLFVDVFFPNVHRRNKGLTRILVFHHLDEPARFERMLQKISKRYNVISFEQYLKNQISTEKINVILSFDDGYESWFNNGSNIFTKFNVKPILSINSDFIDMDIHESKNYCVDNINTWPEKALTWEEVLKLYNSGAYICGHSHEHVDLTSDNVDRGKKTDFVHKDKELIEDIIKNKIYSFTYPYGRYDTESFSILKECGYKYGFTSDSGFLHSNQFPYKIKRTNVGMRHYLVVFSFIEGWSEYITYITKRVRGLF